MLDQLLLGAAGILVGALAKNYIPKWWNSMMAKFRKDAKEKAKEYLKDPEWKAIVSQIVLKVQKEAGEADNIEKLKMATKWIKAAIPTNLDDIIIDAMVELIIEEIKKPIEL